MLVFCRELIELGLAVDLIVVKLEGPLKQLIPNGVSVIDLKSRRTTLALPKLVSYLKKTRPVALYSTIMNANVVAAMAGVLSGTRTPTIVRESNAPLSSPKSTVSRWVTYKVAPFIYQFANGVIAVSQGVADELGIMAPRMKERIRVIPTPVISDDVVRQGDAHVDHPWFTTRDKPIIVSAARLERHKGFFSLLQAFAELRKSKEARLAILGQGSMHARIEAEIVRLGLSGDVALLGFQHNPFAYMSKADAFVLASEFEGLPNVLVQAMAFGTPIVATDCKSGPSEILCGGRYGTLVPVGDARALTQGLERALNLPRQLEAMAHARSMYGARNAAHEYLAMAGLVV
jgi:glycosyltransferase involved in cell wall biosynthesis